MVLKLKTHEPLPNRTKLEERKRKLSGLQSKKSTDPLTIKHASNGKDHQINGDTNEAKDPSKDPDLPPLTAQNRRTDRLMLPRRG